MTRKQSVPGSAGFTLLELSIVLAIIAIVTGMSVQMGISVIETARLTSTQKKMKTIDDALMQYRTANDRLPCPADLTIKQGAANYGIEGATPGTCTGGSPLANHSAAGATYAFATAAEGAVPVATLGLPNDFMVDGWGNRFRYAVDVSMTALGAFASTPAACNYGAITVNDANGGVRTSSAIYALVSHGPNGHGAYSQNGGIVNSGSSSADELTNCHCTRAGVYNNAYAPNYVQKLPQYDAAQTGNALYYFDDLVTFKERWQMRTDWDIAACPTVYVADANNNRVEAFSNTGIYLLGIGAGYNGLAGSIGSSGTGNGQFSIPYGSVADTSGHLWVTDRDNHRVQEFNSSGSFLMGIGAGYNGVAGSIGSSGNGNGQLNQPFGVAIDTSGNVWVMDTQNNRVQKFNSSGSFLMGIGAGYNGVAGSIDSSGTGNGQFAWPLGISVDASSNIWVADSSNNRLQKFNSSGSFLMGIGAGYNGVAGSIGSSGASNGQFIFPYGPSIDINGNIWAADSGENRIQEFNSSGTFLRGVGAGYNGVAGSIGSSGTGNGQFNYPDAVQSAAGDSLCVNLGC